MAKYLDIFGKVSGHIWQSIWTYFKTQLWCLSFPLSALLLPVGKSRISDLWSKILTLGKNKLKQALFVFPLA